MQLYQPTITGSLSVSGSVNISGSITIAGGGTISGTASIATNAITASSADNFLVRNTLTAQTLVVQTVTSSVIYSSGSNIFGNNIANTQIITGSVTVTGSLAVVTNGTEFQVTSAGVKMGNVIGDTHTITGSVGISGSLSGSSAAFSGQLIASSTSGGTAVIFQNTGAQNSNGIELRGGTTGTTVNWKLEKDNTVNNTFQLTPSTTNGGTTYTTPALSISSTGAATFSSTVTAATKLSVGTSSTLSGVDMWIHSNSSTNVNVARLALTTDATGHTASDGSWIHVENTGLYIDNYENDAIIFGTNTLERMRVTSNGSSATLGSGGIAKIIGSGTNSGYTELQFYTYNGPTNQPPVSIGIIKTDNGGYENGEFYIATKSSNANTAPVERMRITSGGALQMVGAGYLRNALQSSYFGYNGVYRTLIVGSTGTDYLTDSVTLCFGVDVSGNANGSFSGNGTEYIWRNAGSFKSPNSANNNYNTLLSWNSSGVVTVTTSDYRAKEDLKSFEALPMVNAMKLYDFRWIELQERMHGVIAHELQEIVPYAVIGEKDGGSMQGVDYSKLVPIMLKAIQEQQAQIEAQQQQINTLLNK